MDLYIVRHGIAIDREDPKSPAEAERYLTEEGIQKTKQVAKSMAALGLRAGIRQSQNPENGNAFARSGAGRIFSRAGASKARGFRILLRSRPQRGRTHRSSFRRQSANHHA